MENEYYYRYEIEKRINDLLNEDISEDVGYIPEDAAKRMADAAFAVLQAIRDTNDYFTRNDMLK